MAAAALTGCGSGGHVGGHLNFKGHTHPAGTVGVSIAVVGGAVNVSPQRLGAGPMIFNVVNTAARRETVRVQTKSGRVAVSTGPIPAGGTAQIKAQINTGSYTVTSGDTKPGSLRVGRPRGGGNDLIEQP